MTDTNESVSTTVDIGYDDRLYPAYDGVIEELLQKYNGIWESSGSGLGARDVQVTFGDDDHNIRATEFEKELTQRFNPRYVEYISPYQVDADGYQIED